MKILMAEDDEVSRRILELTLTAWGHRAVITQNGTEAWSILQREDAPRLAILDWMMPGMDGIEVCRRVRQNRALRRPISFSSRQRAVRQISYIAKPVRQSQLFQCLTSVISQLPVVTEPAIADKALAIVTKHTLVETKAMSNKLVLLAEDNVVNQKVALRQLQKLGYRADAVADGREALQALGRIPYDLVLMDCCPSLSHPRLSVCDPLHNRGRLLTRIDVSAAFYLSIEFQQTRSNLDLKKGNRLPIRKS